MSKLAKPKEMTVIKLGEWLKDHDATLHISSKGDGKGRTYCVILTKECDSETPQVRQITSKSTTVYSDNLEWAIDFAMTEI